jgi:tRNA pseudouridine55 synthase
MSRPEAEGYLDPFRGEIEQIPSMYSALKVDGQPLYKLARQWIEVERKARPVTIFRLTLLEQTNDTWVIDLVCSKGTYVRTLAEDLGAAIGCGAHVVALRRRQAGPFQIDESYSLDELDEIKIENAIEGLDAVLLPVSAAVDDYPEVEMTDLTASYFLQGQAVQIAGVSGEGMVAVYAETDEVRNFVGVGSILDDGRIAPRRLVTTR